MMTQPKLEMGVWSHEDYDRMGWHDAYIHGWACIEDTYELLFDMDYIVQWVEPQEGEQHFSFWISPVTLVFEGVSDVHIDLKSSSGEVTLQELRRESPQITPSGRYDYLWTLDANEGTIRLRSVGFRQHFRQPPLHVRDQRLPLTLRGGLSFDRPSLSAERLQPGIAPR